MTAIEEARLKRAFAKLKELGLLDLVKGIFANVEEVKVPLGMYALGYIELDKFIHAVQDYAARGGSA